MTQNLPNYTDFEIPPRYQPQQPIAIDSPIVKPTKIKMSVNQVAPYQPTKFPPYHFTPSSPYHSLAWMSPTLACHRAHRPPCHYHDIDEPFERIRTFSSCNRAMPSGVQTTVFWTLSIQWLDHFSAHEAEARQKNYWILYFWWGWVVMVSRKGWKIDLVTCEQWRTSVPPRGWPSVPEY